MRTLGAQWLVLLVKLRTHVFCSRGTLTFPAKITKQLNTQKDSITGLKKTPLHVPLLKVQSVWEICLQHQNPFNNFMTLLRQPFPE